MSCLPRHRFKACAQDPIHVGNGKLAYADFEPEIADDSAALQAYYEANQQRYEIPERIEASYAYFSTQGYSDADASYDEAALREHFAAQRAKFVADYEAAQPAPEPLAEGEAEPEPAAVTFETVQDAVLADYRALQAERAANDAAQAFALRLYDESIEQDSVAFNSLLREYGVSLQAIEPFTQAGASQRALPGAMLKEAFALNQPTTPASTRWTEVLRFSSWMDVSPGHPAICRRCRGGGEQLPHGRKA